MSQPLYEITSLITLERGIDEQIEVATTAILPERQVRAALVAVALELRALRWAMAGKPADDTSSVGERLVSATHGVASAIIGGHI